MRGGCATCSSASCACACACWLRRQRGDRGNAASEAGATTCAGAERLADDGERRARRPRTERSRRPPARALRRAPCAAAMYSAMLGAVGERADRDPRGDRDGPASSGAIAQPIARFTVPATAPFTSVARAGRGPVDQRGQVVVEAPARARRRHQQRGHEPRPAAPPATSAPPRRRRPHSEPAEPPRGARETAPTPRTAVATISRFRSSETDPARVSAARPGKSTGASTPPKQHRAARGAYRVGAVEPEPRARAPLERDERRHPERRARDTGGPRAGTARASRAARLLAGVAAPEEHARTASARPSPYTSRASRAALRRSAS